MTDLIVWGVVVGTAILTVVAWCSPRPTEPTNPTETAEPTDPERETQTP